MDFFQGRRRARTFWSSTPAALALTVVVVLLIVSAVRIVIREERIRRERQDLEREKEALELEITRLRAIAEQAGSAEAVERLAKEKLNLKKPGEEVVVVTPRTTATSNLPRTASFSGRFFPNLLRAVLDFFRR